jgi:hypothetical protein
MCNCAKKGDLQMTFSFPASLASLPPLPHHVLILVPSTRTASYILPTHIMHCFDSRSRFSFIAAAAATSSSHSRVIPVL